MPKLMKKRHRCTLCGAYKYAKYMRYHRFAVRDYAWICQDQSKCEQRKNGYGVSYR